jgi:thymidylate synthase
MPTSDSAHRPPVLKVEGRTLPEVWEAAVLQLAEKGIGIPTEYDPVETSLDAVMVMVVLEPMAEPRIHTGAAVGNLAFYDEYVAEILDGINDEEVFEGRLSYTYHQRLFDYSLEDSFRRPDLKGKGINQFQYIVEKLASASFSRRAQAITWNPKSDPNRDDPPCLQRLWFRIFTENDEPFLMMHSHWRSRDALHAAFLNMYALTLLQARIAQQITEKIGTRVQVGQYVDVSDSFHIYERTKDSLEQFLKTAQKLPPTQKYWSTSQLRKFIEQTATSTTRD